MTNIGTREEWLAARSDLLEREKELTRRSDELARERMALPWVPVEQDYSFCTVDGSKPLTDLFGECSQLLVYHLMMGPDWTEACSGCTYTADSLRPRGRAPPAARRRVRGRLARAGARDRGLQGEDGLELPLGLLRRVDASTRTWSASARPSATSCTA